MKLLSPKLHGIIDYVSVGGLVLAPTLFGLNGAAATLAYALAGIHLTMTLLTAFPLGLIKLVPLRLHGVVEIVVGVSLVVAPWVLATTLDLGGTGRVFYTAFGAVLIAVWLITDYSAAAADAPLREG
jgi:hypothetical protein